MYFLIHFPWTRSHCIKYRTYAEVYMNDIFEPRPFSVSNSIASLDYELQLSIEQPDLTPAEVGDKITEFEDQDFVEFLHHYHFLSSAERAFYCLGLDDEIWDGLYPTPEFYGLNGNDTESKWDRWYYGIYCHKDDIQNNSWVTNPYEQITAIKNNEWKNYYNRMTTTITPSWGAAIAAHIQKAKAEKDGYKDGAYAAFTKPGFTYTRFPLRASQKQIRNANHFMLQQGYCYLRLFAVKYRRQIAQCIGSYPTIDKVMTQLVMHPTFRRNDNFVTAYISGPFLGHITKSKKENPFYLGTLRRLSEGMPIRLGASVSSQGKRKDKDGDTPMIDMALIPFVAKDGKWKKSGPPIQVPENSLTKNQVQLLERAHADIICAQQAGLPRPAVYQLECRFNALIKELNLAYDIMKTSQQEGLQYFLDHLLTLTQKSHQFSVDVYQTILKTSKDAEQ